MPDLPRSTPTLSPSADLAGKRALVTGAGSGIGRAVAVRLAAAGATVHALDLNADAAKSVADEVGGRAVVCDLGDLASLDRLEPDLLDVDVLVNNAGIQHVAPIHEFPPERFRLLLTIMLEAPFELLRRTLPGMYARSWGRVVHVTSVHGHRASAYKSAYVSAKHGMEGLSKVVALEAAPYGVTSNCVAPGYVRTPLVEGQLAAQAQAHNVPEDRVVDDVLLANTPLKRLVEPEEVADLVAWLTGPSAASVTGASFVMDGGWTAH